MNRHPGIELAETLFHLRAALGVKKIDPIVKIHLGQARIATENALRALHLDPGTTTLDADHLKLSLIHERAPAEPHPFEVLLQEAAEIDGSTIRGLHIQLGRFLQFWERAVYATPRTDARGEVIPAVIPDDPVAPVGDFLHGKDRPDAEDLLGWARLYVAWCRWASSKLHLALGLGSNPDPLPATFFSLPAPESSCSETSSSAFGSSSSPRRR